MMTAARSPLPLEFEVIPEQELDKLTQKVERLGKFLRIRILSGSPEEEVGAWSDHRLHHEECFTDWRHHTIIFAPGHQDFIKNLTTDALEMPKITGMKQDPAANHRASCGQARVARRSHYGEADQDQQDVPMHLRDWAEKEADHPGRDQAGQDSSGSATKPLKRQVLTIQATQH